MPPRAKSRIQASPKTPVTRRHSNRVCGADGVCGELAIMHYAKATDQASKNAIIAKVRRVSPFAVLDEPSK